MEIGKIWVATNRALSVAQCAEEKERGKRRGEKDKQREREKGKADLHIK